MGCPSRDSFGNWAVALFDSHFKISGIGSGIKTVGSIAISRAGAGSVGEVWANAVPTIFYPYPYHKDQHQRLNAEPLVRIGSAMMHNDWVDPMRNARELTGPLLSLMSNTQRRIQMAETMRDKLPPDGAAAVAKWLLHAVG